MQTSQSVSVLPLSLPVLSLLYPAFEQITSGLTREIGIFSLTRIVVKED